MDKKIQTITTNNKVIVKDTKDLEIERLNKMLDEKFMKENKLLVENGIICIKNREIKELSETLQKIKKIIDNEKITGIEAKLMIKDIFEKENKNE